ncbi:MAG: 2-amino-4-hydroxy-6-hydroxymethyldihydropteridine diphosphokinase, partial [Hyphomicrobiales bacterium]|nr:2-amino-4-hydroxy-6-hydroxymethyldihydropteridine diphosphokinase [Hyphomicrobiales bacterium]
RAVALLDAVPGIRVTARSRNFRTAPWGITDQDWFVNAAILVETTLAPRALLEACLDIETRLGRVRSLRWGPRLIDLDILLYGDLAIVEPGLAVPHPRMMERAFVLAPLADLMPARLVAGRRVDDVLAELGDSDVVPLDQACSSEGVY